MDLPVKAPSSGNRGARYKLKTKNLSYGLSRRNNQQDENKHILKNVNCEAKPGEITAIAGPSGAGKTTFLEILAGNVRSGRISGHVLVNDGPMNVADFRRVSGHVTQDEALFPLLTVEETLMYSARLRLGGGRERAKVRVRDLLTELSLEHVSAAKIGNESTRGISGGEKRRVSIGVDLVHNPAVLFIDEPTSGLDSASALHVVLLLKSMAKNQGKTIVLTIHQPGFRILELFDRVLLLSDGIVLHNGSLELLEERLKFAGHCIPRHVNVLEFAIDLTENLLTEIEVPDDVTERLTVCKTEENQAVKAVNYPNSVFGEVFILGRRFCSNIFRTKQLFAARTIQALLAGILLGTIFMNANNDPKKTRLQTQVGFFAFSLTFLLSSTTEALPIFLQERRILLRETSRGAYRVSSYTIANFLVFVPFLLVVALLYSTPVYWLVGLRPQIDGFLYFSLVVWMVLLMSNSFVSCFSALVPDFITGMSLVAGIMGSFFLFSGYFISKDDIPKYWIFVHYLSLFKYPFECLMINEFGGERGKWRCLERREGECLLYGDQFLEHQRLDDYRKWSNLVVMSGFVLGYRVLCFLILWYRSYRNRC